MQIKREIERLMVKVIYFLKHLFYYVILTIMCLFNEYEVNLNSTQNKTQDQNLM